MSHSLLVRLTLICVPLLVSSSPAAAQPAPAAAVAQRVFADLLRIPPEAPDVAVRVLGTDEQDGLVTEDLAWESLDGQVVPAYLVRPAASPVKRPAVICLHGTGGSRESMTTLRFERGPWTSHGASNSHIRLVGWARELARRGHVVLALTQRGLDRRLPDTAAQNKELLVRGRNIMGAIVYEIRQAVTYLESHPSVLADRIGVAGLSFGGITGFYTWLVDSRLAAVVSICGGVGSVETLLAIGSRDYHGIYWWVPDMLTWGDQGDFAAAQAPRPLMVWAPLDDIGMPKEGVERFLQVVQPAYRQAGAEDRLVVHRPPGEHTFSFEAFEALDVFFRTHLVSR